jgi:hypothetical protein
MAALYPGNFLPLDKDMALLSLAAALHFPTKHEVVKIFRLRFSFPDAL